MPSPCPEDEFTALLALLTDEEALACTALFHQENKPDVVDLRSGLPLRPFECSFPYSTNDGGKRDRMVFVDSETKARLNAKFVCRTWFLLDEDEFSSLLALLTDEQILACETAATDRLFNVRFLGLAGKYHILNRELVRGDATEEEMLQDAARFRHDAPGYAEYWQAWLLDDLSDAWDEEFYEALLAMAQAKERRGKDV